MGLYSLSDLEYMFWAAIRNGSVGTIGAKGDPGGISLGTQLSNTVSLDTIQTSGVYRLTSTYSGLSAYNFPRDNDSGILVVMERVPAQTIEQEWHSFMLQSKGYYIRSFVTSSWTPWRFMPTSRVDQTAGRAIYQYDDVNSREQLVYGDTGERDISVNVSAGTAGAFKVRRVNYSVEIRVVNLQTGVAGSQSLFSAGNELPVGLRPNNTVELVAWDSTNGVPLRLQWGANTGQCTIYGAAANSTISFNVMFFSYQNWPTTLPGTAVGTIPNL